MPGNDARPSAMVLALAAIVLIGLIVLFLVAAAWHGGTFRH